MKKVDVFAPFQKIDQEQRIVEGYASTEAMDSQGEIVLKQAVAAALPDFMKYGNIREMHQPSAVGRAYQARMDEKGLWIAAKIVDDAAWAKVREGVYQGFSIGGAVTARDEDDPKIVTGCSVQEISLVDRPANPEAKVVMFKAEVSAPESRSADPMQKEGRRNAAADQARIQRMHDMSVDLGAACAACPPMMPDTAMTGMMGMADFEGAMMAKVSQSLAQTERQMRALEGRCRDLAERLERLERMPAPAKGVLRRLDKGTDLGLVHDQAEPDNPHDMIKQALRQPRHF